MPRVKKKATSPRGKTTLKKKATSPRRKTTLKKKATSPRGKTTLKKKATSPRRKTTLKKKATSPRRKTTLKKKATSPRGKLSSLDYIGLKGDYDRIIFGEKLTFSNSGTLHILGSCLNYEMPCSIEEIERKIESAIITNRGTEMETALRKFDEIFQKTAYPKRYPDYISSDSQTSRSLGF